jgi:hypothetical protein
MTLAREWLVSAVTVRLGLPLDPSLTDRNSIEKNLGDLRQLAQTPAASGGQTPGGAGTLKQYTLIMYDTWADWRELVRLRKQVGDIRNALDHAGYQAQPMPMEQIVSDIDQVVMPNLCALAADWGFWESEDAAA